MYYALYTFYSYAHGVKQTKKHRSIHTRFKFEQPKQSFRTVNIATWKQWHENIEKMKKKKYRIFVSLYIYV